MARVTPTVPITTLIGGDPEFSISDKDWARIESGYGKAMPPDVRVKIFEAMLTFLSLIEGEQSAQPISKALDRVNQIRKAAMNFRKELFQVPEQIGRDAKVYADHLVTRNLQSAGLKQQYGLRYLGNVMTALIIACRKTIVDLGDPKNQGRYKGNTWDLWVCVVTTVVKAHNLPTQVRKDTDKNISGKPSAFVALIRELQALFPEQTRRSTHSDIALAEAITRARQGRRVRNPMQAGSE